MLSIEASRQIRTSRHILAGLDDIQPDRGLRDQLETLMRLSLNIQSYLWFVANRCFSPYNIQGP